MNIFYHPSQVDAENERVQKLKEDTNSQIAGTPNTVATEQTIPNAQITPNRLNTQITPPNSEGQASTQPPTDSLIQSLSQPAQIDPRLQASLDRFAPDPEPNGVPVPKGFKQRLLFGLANALQTMGTRAQQLPAYSTGPVDDPIGILASGIASGVGSAANPNQALKERYYRQILPAYYQREAAKAQMRKEILTEAKLQGEVGAQSSTELKKRLDAILTGRNIQAKGIENEYLPGNLQNRNDTGAANATIARANAGNIETTIANRNELAKAQIAKTKQDLELQHGTLPYKIASAKAAAAIAGQNAETNPRLRESQIARNYRTAEGKVPSLTIVQKSKADAEDAWRAEEPRQLAVFAAMERKKLEAMKNTDPDAYALAVQGFDNHVQKLWAKQKDKIKKEFISREYTSNMRKNGGYQPSRSDLNAIEIKKGLLE